MSVQKIGILQCLFCGKGKFSNDLSRYDYFYQVICHSCGARGPKKRTFEEAGLEWNLQVERLSWLKEQITVLDKILKSRKQLYEKEKEKWDKLKEYIKTTPGFFIDDQKTKETLPLIFSDDILEKMQELEER